MQQVKQRITIAATALQAAQNGDKAPNHENWLAKLDRLQPFEVDLALLPIGWGNEQKGPMLSDWQHHGGFTAAELQQHRRIRSVGARTGLLTGPLLAFDFDGATSLNLGLNPATAGSWQVHRNTDPNRLKVLFKPTLEQLEQLPGGAEFSGKTITAPATETAKGEALEVFFDGGRQVIILGEHPSSNGYYYWPDGMGPEQLTAPPAEWWAHALQIANKCHDNKTTGSKPCSRRNGTRRLNPCPICGRHGSLWCEQTQQGLILCMPGSTFSAEQRHGPLRIGQVVDGWALVKRTPINDGDVLTFKAHRPRRQANG
ncbi:hypothetical protein KBY79_11815 [Synechococcus lacustris C3-12m-Tous]|uniref:hypothetical protein n=1 Tax=Synechococcus lacustris TaxID=2116544 RepID=UPI0020CD0DA7|nr:hypothetical protein [Synechococcus lacustris]MCP9925893.1 hypothetical protein [Synechococcus lacustris C3-12m-Tous]